jgi:hypothetical protein
MFAYRQYNARLIHKEISLFREKFYNSYIFLLIVNFTALCGRWIEFEFLITLQKWLCTGEKYECNVFKFQKTQTVIRDMWFPTMQHQFDQFRESGPEVWIMPWQSRQMQHARKHHRAPMCNEIHVNSMIEKLLHKLFIT